MGSNPFTPAHPQLDIYLDYSGVQVHFPPSAQVKVESPTLFSEGTSVLINQVPGVYHWLI